MTDGEYNVVAKDEVGNASPSVTVTVDMTLPKLTEPVKINVVGPANLTDEEKAKVAEVVRKANPHLPFDTIITVLIMVLLLSKFQEEPRQICYQRK